MKGPPQRIHISTEDSFFSQRLRLFFADHPQYRITLDSYPDPAAVCDVYLIPVQRLFSQGKNISRLKAPVIAWGPGDLLSQAFRWGAADYIKQPFSCEELYCRLHRILPRQLKLSPENRLSRQGGQFLLNGQFLTLRGLEKAVLCQLFQYAGSLVTRRTLYSAVWHHENIQSRSLDTTVYTLRKEIHPRLHDKLSAKDVIITVPQYGYSLSAYE